MRPRGLQMLALRLADVGRSAVVALTRPAEHLVAVGLLAAEMRRALGAGAHAPIAPLTGSIYEALVGEADSKDTGSLFLGCREAQTD